MYIQPEHIAIEEQNDNYRDTVEYTIRLKLGASRMVTKREQDNLAYLAQGGLNWVRVELIKQLSYFIYGDIADLIGKLGDTKMSIQTLYGRTGEFRNSASHQELVNRAIQRIDQVIGGLEKLKIETEYPEND